MAINYAGSAAYFVAGQHVKAKTWADAGEDACTAAIAQARRILGRALRRAMNDDEAAYAEGDATRDEYAVYEQALWLIENGTIATSEGTAALAELAGGQDAGARGSTPAVAALYAPEALRWLGWTVAAMVSG